jgi:hypothetical protein
MNAWRPIRPLSPVEAKSVREGACWFNKMPCREPVLCSMERVRCRRELEADCDSGYYGKEHMKDRR